LTDLDAAVRLNPNFADAYQNRGVIKNSLKLFPEALADFDQALELNPGKNNGAIYVGRGISKLYLGEKAGAARTGAWRRPAARPMPLRLPPSIAKSRWAERQTPWRLAP